MLLLLEEGWGVAAVATALEGIVRTLRKWLAPFRAEYGCRCAEPQLRAASGRQQIGRVLARSEQPFLPDSKTNTRHPIRTVR
jgi:hypothetical protein